MTARRGGKNNKQKRLIKPYPNLDFTMKGWGKRGTGSINDYNRKPNYFLS